MLHVQGCFLLVSRRKVCCTCKVVFLLVSRRKVWGTCKVVFFLIRSSVIVFYRSRCFHLFFSVTRFYIFFKETIYITCKDCFAFSPG